MQSSFVSTSLKVTALLIFLVCFASQTNKNLADVTATWFGDRDTLGTFITSCFNRVTTQTLDSGGERTFRLNQREWKVFEVHQDADEGCECTVTCLDTKARVDMYVTYERRARLNDNWDGWDCKQTLALSTQTCAVPAPEPGSTCRVAVHGYLFERRFSDCLITCTVDDDQCPREGRC